MDKTKAQMKKMIDENESIIWEGHPLYKAYLFNRLCKTLPFVLIWGLIDLFFLCMVFKSNNTSSKFFIVVFLLFHLFPVWQYIASLITAKQSCNNEYYIVTDKRILLRHGFVGFNIENIYYQNIKDLNYHVGFIDSFFNVGDIYFINSNSNHNKAHQSYYKIHDIENVDKIFTLIQKTTRDIASDIYYPNDFRPGENHGYRTHYKS